MHCGRGVELRRSAGLTAAAPAPADPAPRPGGARPRYLYIEPFDRGAHAAFTQEITGSIDAHWTVLTLPGRHWKWRMRGSAAWFATACRAQLKGPFDAVLASAYLDLAAFKALAPAAAAGAPTALYFHENQLEYPMRPEFSGERDLHYGFTQLVSAWAANACWFNSQWNLRSFVDAGRALLDRMPDHRPPGWIDEIESRSAVLPFPLVLPELDAPVDTAAGQGRSGGPIVLWNHRWEHDKAPEVFVRALLAVAGRGTRLRLAICGAGRPELPAELAAMAIHVGRVEERDAYWALLGRAHLAVSTAIHEFFGVSVLEAVHAGARPLAPDRLAYQQTLPSKYRYDSEEGLVDELQRLCEGWRAGRLSLRKDRRHLLDPYRSERLIPRYTAALGAL